MASHRKGASYALACVLFAGSAAQAQTPPDLQDLVGARGAGGETQMQARGYQWVRATRVRDQSWTFWWSDVQRACVAISTTDGRYATINRVPEQNCRPGGTAVETPPQPHRPDAVTLICYGQGEHVAYSAHTGYEWNERHKRYEPMQRMESGTEQFQTGVQFDFRDGSGRVHLTGKLIPPLNSGGSDGWWPLEDVQMSPDRITARYRINALNRPTVDIDRHSGLVEIKGMTGFSGKCDAGDWGAGRRF